MNGSRVWSPGGGSALILGVAVCALAFQPFSASPYVVKSLAVYLTAVVLIIGVPQRVRIATPLWGVTFWAALSALWSARPVLALEQALLWASYATVLGGASALDDAGRRRVMRALGVVGAATMGYAALQAVGGDPFPWNAAFGGRVFATFGNPNFYAGYLLSVWPVCAYCAVAEPERRGWWTAAAVGAGICLVLTGTRGAILAAVPMLGLWMFFQDGIRARLWRAVLSGVAAIAVVAVILAGAFRGDASVAERQFKWAVGMRMFADHPMAGVGAGNLPMHFATYRARVLPQGRVRMKSSSESHVHNEYVQTLAETGIVGMALLLTAAAVLLGHLVAGVQVSPDPGRSAELAGICALGGALLYAVSNFPFACVPSGMACITAVGCCLPREPGGTCAASSRNERMVRLALAVLLALGSWIFGVRRVAAGYHAARGVHLRASGEAPAAVETLERAARLDPYHAERILHELGETYRGMGDLRSALLSYERLARLRPYAETFNNLGNCRYLLGDLAGARVAWETALALGMPDPADDDLIRANLRVITADAPTS